MNNVSRGTYKLLGDLPVLEGGRADLLNFSFTAKVLASAAMETENPLTIGIFGDWGSGKTSLMRLIKKEVEEQKEQHDAAAVWFNAWQYEKENDLIIPLIATIKKELDRHTWPEAVKEGAEKIGKALLSILKGLSVKGKIEFPLMGKAEVGFSGKELLKSDKEPTKDAPVSRSLYFDAFEALASCVNGKAPRIVVFVDDLDRCFPDRAVALLEGIKLVLHQRGFAFVIGVNEAIIQDFVKTKYVKDYHIEGAFFEDYLDKIVQVKISVPRRETDDMKEYIGSLLHESNVFCDDLIADAIPFIADACKSNPRSIVRFLNRIVVTIQIGKLEGKHYDPLLLLIHIATDEPRYKALRDALAFTVIKEGEQQGKTIGAYLSEKMNDNADQFEFIEELHKITLINREDTFNDVIEILDKNKHLWKLLKSEKGRVWLIDKDLRRTLEKAAEITLGERRIGAGRANEKNADDLIKEL